MRATGLLCACLCWAGSAAFLAAVPRGASRAPQLHAVPAALGRHRASTPRLSFAFGRGRSGPAGPSEEAQALYRMLGIAEDADYDEIVGAYDKLCEKYEGQTKRLIKLQVAKDKILEDRLRQRMQVAPAAHRTPRPVLHAPPHPPVRLLRFPARRRGR